MSRAYKFHNTDGLYFNYHLRIKKLWKSREIGIFSFIPVSNYYVSKSSLKAVTVRYTDKTPQALVRCVTKITR